MRAHLKEVDDMFIAERRRVNERFKEYDGTLLKILQIPFIFENEQLTKIDRITGNDLETSEVLYSTLFYLISKERLFTM